MRTVHIDFLTPENPLPDGNILGNQGEHNATILAVTPPAEMTANENITSYRIAFELTNCRAVHSKDIAKADIISLPLFSQITLSETVAVQLEGYDENGDVIVKSPKIKKLKFNPSVCGIEIPPSDSPNSMAAEVTANTAFRNKFGEDENGNLLYKGESISTTERPFITISGMSSDLLLQHSTHTGNVMLFLLNNTYEGHDLKGCEIKSLSFVFDGTKINVKALSTLDSRPYCINMSNLIFSPYFGLLYVATLYDILAQSDGYSDSLIGMLSTGMSYEVELEIYL